MNQLKELYISSTTGPIIKHDLHKSGGIKAQNVIVACPNPPIEAVKAGKAIAIPKRSFDIDIILNKLPAGFSPDIVYLSARKMSFMPQGLERFNCPKVMKLGDTYQWGDGSLSEMIEYCQILNCDYHWIYQGVQHLHFFKEAGLKNVFWLPGTIATDYFVPEQNTLKEYEVCFRASLGSVHIYRRKLVNFLQDSGVKLDVAQKPYLDSLKDYTKSKIVLNCSGGGDTNRRIFEVLMAGGFLLTDRLSKQSGLQCLFQEGVHLECYGSPEELLEKVNYYLAHPEEAERIALAGHQKLIDEYHPDLVREKLLNFVLKGQIEPLFLLEQDKRASLGLNLADRSQLKKRLKIYELIQCIHHQNLKTKLLYWNCQDKYLVSDLADLPRLEITCRTTQKNFKEIYDWCSQAEVLQEIQLHQHDSLPPTNSFSIVMLDISNNDGELISDLQEANKYLSDGGLLLLVGQIPKTLPAKLEPIARQKGWTKVKLIENSSLKFMGVDFHLAYQKQSRKLLDNSNYLAIKTNKELNLKERGKRKLNLLASNWRK